METEQRYSTVAEKAQLFHVTDITTLLEIRNYLEDKWITSEDKLKILDRDEDLYLITDINKYFVEDKYRRGYYPGTGLSKWDQLRRQRCSQMVEVGTWEYLPLIFK